jgi:membrane glycosyltransferase
MTEKQPHIANDASKTQQDWPTLLGRAVDDITRILQSEAHMLQATMGAVLETRLASAIATLTIISVIICGGVCMLCAAILLLHQWLPLWEAFGLAGAAILLIGFAGYPMMKPRYGGEARHASPARRRAAFSSLEDHGGQRLEQPSQNPRSTGCEVGGQDDVGHASELP